MAFGKFGKYSPGVGPYRPEPFDLVTALTDAIVWFRGQDHSHREIRFGSDVDHYPVQTDLAHLRYIIINLLQNAAKYSAAGTAIDVELFARGTLPRFVVTDRGIGVPAVELEALFSPFYRASNVGDRPGTGMGLPIVRESARTIGAEVTVASEVGRGSAFTVTLPGRLGRPPG